MPERLMPQVVRQGRCLGRILIETSHEAARARIQLAPLCKLLQTLRKTTGHLGNLDRMRQPAVKDEPGLRRGHLGDVSEPEKGGRIENSVAVALTLATDRRGWLGYEPLIKRCGSLIGWDSEALDHEPTGALSALSGCYYR
jgi:hypothetical protein